jgi:hypothetical protein
VVGKLVAERVGAERAVGREAAAVSGLENGTIMGRVTLVLLLCY